MSTLEIRRYEARDYERVYELHVLGLEQTGTHIDSWAHGQDLSSPKALAATYLGNRGDFLVGELDGVIVAMGALRHRVDGKGAVSERWRSLRACAPAFRSRRLWRRAARATSVRLSTAALK